MSSSVAPWLDGISDAWEPAQISQGRLSSSTNNRKSSYSSRIPRRSAVGAIAVKTDTLKTRPPLAPLANGTVRSLRSSRGSLKSPDPQNVSELSDNSVVCTGTVQIQPRSKTSSPEKNQETLEWKRRLIQGQVGYGDQTDLFGPAALEGIFHKSASINNRSAVRNSRMNWVANSEQTMPSSPPPWPLNFGVTGQRPEETSHQDDEDAVKNLHKHALSNSVPGPDDLSRDSEPFDLQCTTDEAGPEGSNNSTIAAGNITTEEHCKGAQSLRAVSGQTAEQEEFSAVYISKHTTIGGRVKYAAWNPQYERESAAPQQSTPEDCNEGVPSSNQAPVPTTDSSTFSDGPGSQLGVTHGDLSLPEDLETGTPPVSALGRHVQLQRGGYSSYGSFKNRQLSRSLSEVSDVTRNHAYAPALSPINMSPRTFPEVSTPPATHGQSRTANDSRSAPSTSPLKLFGPHDTFTNRRLLRRLSELNWDDSTDSADRPVESVSKNRTNTSFGSGELDCHEFNAEITITSASDSEGSSGTQSPASEIPVPGSRAPHAFVLAQNTENPKSFKPKRKLSRHSNSQSGAPTPERSIEPSHAPKSNQVVGKGKRPPNSPSKDPTPKRRRTLHESEIETLAEANQSYKAGLLQSSVLRKRKDSRQGGRQFPADPKIIAQRRILRPRNPTPNQKRQEQLKAELIEATEEFAARNQSQLGAVLEQIESSVLQEPPGSILQTQAEAVASEVAAFTLRISKPSADHGERKRSVTTQDFLNEAVMVMNLIRAKARPYSALGSVEESDGEPANHAHKDALGSMHFSRPPSREGRPSAWRTSIPTPSTDARVINHLRKFEEKDDTEFIADSLASLHVDPETAHDSSILVLAEHENIRITKASTEALSKSAPNSPERNSNRSHTSTLQSHRSNGTSTGRTIATNSTGKSENVGNLAPDAVAHMIPEHIGTMMYDKERRTWIRNKSPCRPQTDFLEPPSQIGSDEDPFKEISDLPVDEQAELRRISAASNFADDRQRDIHTAATDTLDRVPTDALPFPHPETHQASRPVTRDSSHLHPDYSSSVPSRYSAFGSSQQDKVETRATSYNDEELAKLNSSSRKRQQSHVYAAVQAALASRNEHQSIPEEGSHVSSNLNQDSFDTEDRHEEPEPRESASPQGVAGPHSQKSTDLSPRRPLTVPPTHFAPHQMSLRRQTLTHALNISEDREQSEVSLIAALPGERMVSVSLSVSRPRTKPQHHSQVQELVETPSKVDNSFLWSELPEFTMHQDDCERPSEQKLASRLAQHAAAEVNDRYALSVKDLVKTLTDVKEDEPFWEDIKHLDLCGRSLDTLHGLDDFCTRLQSMDVSENSIRHLEGVPRLVRQLKAQSNKLTSLTSWDHLINLQTLDISRNDVDSLEGLGGLYHLRELRADNNAITSLDGIMGLDALLKLRVRRNRIKAVNFECSQLQQLTELDLSSNKITEITSVETLGSLRTLILDQNPLSSGFSIHQATPSLHNLSLRKCELSSLDITNLDQLRVLNVDGNSLAGIAGLPTLRNLDELSMRDQNLPQGMSLAIFSDSLDARTVRLSGNHIPFLALGTAFLNLQHLEMASTGLQDLPDDFGLRMPNLRTLNLNFNFLKDIRPILNVQAIEYLSVCGNRMTRLRKSVATLAKMKTLKTLDMRDNAVTQGFYAPALTTQTNVVRRQESHVEEDEDAYQHIMDMAKQGLPNGDVDQDVAHQGRMDESTKLRRRVYELLLANNCQQLHALDGLGFDRHRAAEKDGVFHRLIDLGVMRKRE